MPAFRCNWIWLSLLVILAWQNGWPVIVEGARPSNPRRKVNKEVMAAAAKKLARLDTRKTPGSWMRAHPEQAQSLAAYQAERPLPPVWDYTVLYVQPVGDFSPEQQEIVGITRDYLARLYGVPVKSLEPLAENAIPASARRVHPADKQPQILSAYVLRNLLQPQRPKDAVAVLGLTAADLWPGEGWNFVFGQASLQERVGVWSLNRFGDPAAGEASRRLCLLRTLKVAGHETGHMFGLPHCTRSECGMNGSNHRDEMDEIRLPFCAECAAKVWWATDRDPADWYDALIEFADDHKLEEESAYWQMYRQGLKAADR
ncbi:MAG: archaemetzincin [Pirellulales bacterium]